MKKLLLGTLLALGISGNAMAVQSTYCSVYAHFGDMRCAAIITVEILFPPAATVGTTLGAANIFTWRDFHKSEAVQTELAELEVTGELGGVLRSVVGQIQTQAFEKSGVTLSTESVLQEIEFMSLQ
jgi:hypothetical protein